MMKTAVNIFQKLVPGLGYVASRRWFDHISTYDSGRHLLFMNYGYAADPPLKLLPEDEEHRYSIQLYHHVAAAVDLAGLKVLEVGCGRGGGASYATRYLKPKSMIGVDLSANAIAFCNDFYRLEGLSFERRDAENLQFSDKSFDAVLNVESSVCYPHPEKFFAEVRRVLRPGGYFLYADVRNREELAMWDHRLEEMKLDKLEEEEITAGVLQALKQDSIRRKRLIQEHVPRPLQKIFHEFAGTEGTNFFFGAFARQEKVYKRFLFRKATGKFFS